MTTMKVRLRATITVEYAPDVGDHRYRTADPEAMANVDRYYWLHSPEAMLHQVNGVVVHTTVESVAP